MIIEPTFKPTARAATPAPLMWTAAEPASTGNMAPADTRSTFWRELKSRFVEREQRFADALQARRAKMTPWQLEIERELGP